MLNNFWKLCIVFILAGVLQAQAQVKDYYIVQNVASLTIRLYEDGKLVLQAPMVVGRNEIDPKDGTDCRTILGAFRIGEWRKFYYDNKESYIAWNGRKMPKRGMDRKRWGAQGAFGVYTAIMQGNTTAFQHLHGTVGWPNESVRFIRHEVKEDGQIHRVGSKGCTRVDNLVIMFLRNFVPVGTPVYKIYAMEKMGAQVPVEYGKWAYILYETKDLDVPHPLNYEYRKFVGENTLFEVGDFVYQQTPTPVNVANPRNRGKDYATNPYNINKLYYFNVETGKLERGYKDPPELKRGGEPYPPHLYE